MPVLRQSWATSGLRVTASRAQKTGESASAKAEQTMGCPRKEANSLLEPNRWLRPEAITTHPTKTGLASCFILDTSYRKKAEKFIPRKLRAKVCF